MNDVRGCARETKRYTVGHSAAHLLGAALEQQFPGALLCDGPAMEDGRFFYNACLPDGTGAMAWRGAACKCSSRDVCPGRSGETFGRDVREREKERERERERERSLESDLTSPPIRFHHNSYVHGLLVPTMCTDSKGGPVTVTDEDLPNVLKYMRRMVKKNHRFERLVVTEEQAYVSLYHCCAPAQFPFCLLLAGQRFGCCAISTPRLRRRRHLFERLVCVY